MPIERVYDGKGMDAKTLAAIEPFCISYHGVSRANVKEGDKVLVVGAGTIGVLAAIEMCIRDRYPSGRFERLDFRGERENQMRHGIMSALQTLYHVLQTWYPSGGIGAWSVSYTHLFSLIARSGLQ